MMTIEEQIKVLKAEPCRCEQCGACFGQGDIRMSPMDDLSEMETCEKCSGYGILQCDRCQLLSDLDDELAEGLK